MTGINRETGVALDGVDHLRQSIATILTTPIGSRVMRRSFGSRIFELIDAPLTRSTIVDMYAATAEAITTWEPRYALQRVTASNPSPGHVTLHLIGIYRPDGRRADLDIEVSAPRVRDLVGLPRDRLAAVIEGEYDMQRITEQERPDDLGGLT